MSGNIVVDKSSMIFIPNQKSSLSTMTGFVTRSFSVTIPAGQPIGLLLALTYPQSLTVTQWGIFGGVTQ